MSVCVGLSADQRMGVVLTALLPVTSSCWSAAHMFRNVWTMATWSPLDLVLVSVDKAAVLLLTTLEQIVWQTHSLFLQGLSMNPTYLFHELTFIAVCAKWCNCSLGAQSILVTIHFPESRKICQESASHCTLFKCSEEHSFFLYYAWCCYVSSHGSCLPRF